MTPTMKDFGTLVRDSVTRPRAAIRTVLGADWPVVVLVQALVLVAVLGALVVWAGLALTGAGRALLAEGILPGPVALAVVQLAFLLVLVPVIHRIGRAFGGTGDAVGALKVVLWWQIVGLVLQAGELVLELLLPGIGMLTGYAVMFLMFWLLAAFVAEMHGFASTGKVLAGIVGIFFLFALVTSMLVAASGVTQTGGI